MPFGAAPCSPGPEHGVVVQDTVEVEIEQFHAPNPLRLTLPLLAS